MPIKPDKSMAVPHISKGSYVQKSFLSLRDTASKVSQGEISSRTSLSQLKLNLLTEGRHWEVLEDYGLEELRDGFFDPIFTRYERNHSSTSDYPELVKDDYFSYWNHSLVSFLRIEYEHLKQNWEPIVKFFVAFFASWCICLIHPAGSWLGHQYRYFMPIAVLIHHPARTVGVQLEISIWSILGGAFGLGWSSLAWYVSTATKPTSNHQGGILFMSMFIAIFLASWLRTAYQRFFYFSLSFGVSILFLHTADLVNSKYLLDWQLCWDFGISYLFGVLLSLLACVIIFPHCGQSELVDKFSTTLTVMKDLLVTLVDVENCHDLEKLHHLKKEVGISIDIKLSEGYREFSNQLKFTKLNEHTLKKLRNSLTTVAAPLRNLPIDHKLITKVELEHFYEAHRNGEDTNAIDSTNNETPMPISGAATPLPKQADPLSHGISHSTEIYVSVLKSTFSRSILSLIVEMIYVLETLDSTFFSFVEDKLSEEDIENNHKKLTKAKNRLQRKIYKLDVCYKDFTKTDFFCKDLLADPQSVDIFLFLRYLRQAAKHMLSVSECIDEFQNDLRWRVTLPHYPLHRALKRLSHQCTIDQGATTILHYFETKSDVDDIFEKLYNSYTSKHKSDGLRDGEVIRPAIRAVDHKDFNLHTTKHPLRYKLWLFTTKVVSYESKWSLKISFVITFLALPTWLPQSYQWYQEYQCWWSPLIFFILINRRNTGSWSSMLRRFLCALIGIFWGWCANQSRHFCSPYVVATFGGILCALFSFNFFVYRNTKSSFSGLLCFIVIALEPYSKSSASHNTAAIWKNTWVTGLALLIGVALSVPINWVWWSFMARYELRLSLSSLLAHMSQSYQSITDRYLYRDVDDDPTDLTLKLSNVREVRLSQSLIAVKELLSKAKEEPNYISNFKPIVYEELLEACEYVLDRMIEARMSGQYFEVWDQDNDNQITRALLSLRRDSVATVIFVFYILSNCFRSKNKIPKYLPNPIMSRKRLYDFISKFERSCESNVSSAGEKTLAPEASDDLQKQPRHKDDYEKSHWTEVHGMAFARAFTDITEVLQKIIELSKEILGEEPF